jgi:polar amino acid transport system substrate-binding protein
MLIATVLASTSSNAQADTIKLCGVEWLPFTMGEQLDHGISIEINQEAFKRMGHTASISNVPWKRCIDEVREGKFDAMIDAGDVRGFSFPKNPTTIYALSFWVRADAPDTTYKGVESLKGKKVGLVLGYTYSPEIDKIKEWNVDRVTDDETNLKKLAARRVDYIANDIVSCPLVAKRLGITNIRPLLPPFNVYPLGLSFGPKSLKKFAADYDKAIEGMLKDGTIETIYAKYSTIRYSELMRYLKEWRKAHPQNARP